MAANFPPRSAVMRCTYPLSAKAASGSSGSPRARRHSLSNGRTSRQKAPRNSSSAATSSHESCRPANAVAIHERRLQPQLLGGDDGLHHGFHLAFQVMALVDHERDVGQRIAPGQMDFVEDAEDLVGIDGSQREVVVGIAAVVEMEAAQQVRCAAATPRSARCSGSRSGGRCPPARAPAVPRCGPGARPCPSRRCRCDRKPARRACIRPAGADRAPVLVGALQRIFQPLDALANALRARVVGAVGQPQRDIARPQLTRDGDRIEHVRDGALTNLGRGIAERAKLEFLVLEEVGIDGSGSDAILILERCTASASRAPLGRSHNTCRASVGVTPVSLCTWPASLNFSSSVEAAAA